MTRSYAGQLASLLFDRKHSVGRSRMRIFAYSEEGTTTTPFAMMCCNNTDRFNLAATALEMGASTLARRFHLGAALT